MASSITSAFSWDWGETPPSGYVVPTSCVLSKGDPYQSQVADTRTIPDFMSCLDHQRSWMTSFEKLYTTTLSHNTYETFSQDQTRLAAYVAPSDCRSLCTISASRVQLLYWPTPYPISGSNATLTSAAQPKISVDPHGYTFISPTAYVVFSGLSAQGLGGSPGTRTYENITRAYAPDQLSTFYSCSLPWYHTSQINFQDFNVPPRWSVVSAHQNCDGCEQQYLYPDPQQPRNALVSDYTDMNFDQIPWLGSGHSSWTLEPTLAAPPGLTDLDPLWALCTSLKQGIWDPPRTLSAVAELTPTATEAGTSSSVSEPIPNSTAAPASLLISPFASPTSPSSAIDPITSIQALEHSEAPATHPSSSVIDPPVKATPSPWPADPPGEANGASEDPAIATKDPSTGVRTGMPPESLLNPAPPHNPPSRANLEPTAPRSPEISPQPRLTPADIESGTQSPQKVSIGNTRVEATQDETGKANIDGSSFSHTDFTANVDPLSMAAISHSLPPIESPSVIVTISPSDDRDLSRHGNSAGAARLTDQATGALTVPPHSPPTATPHSITAVGEISTSINAPTIVVQDTSLSIGGEALTVSNVGISMGSSGLVVGTTTIAMPSAGIDPARYSKEHTDANYASTVTAGGLTWTFDGDSQIVAGGTTLTKQSHAIMLDGTPFSFGSTALFAGTATISIPITAAVMSHGSLVTAADQTVEQLGHGEVLWNDITITEGASAITIHGNSVSYGSSVLILGTSTIAIPSKTTDPSDLRPLSAADVTFTPVSIPNSDYTASISFGDVIMSGFGTGPAASATSVEAFQGAAVDIFRQKLWVAQALSMGVGLGVWVLCC